MEERYVSHEQILRIAKSSLINDKKDKSDMFIKDKYLGNYFMLTILLYLKMKLGLVN